MLIDSLYFVDFLENYYLIPKPNNDSANDNKPDILVYDLIHNTQEPNNYPSVLPLMSSKEKLKCRRIKAVLRYHVPNLHKHPEKYARHMLFMFYLFRNETSYVLMAHT